MNNRRTLKIAGIAVALFVLAAVAVWWFVLRSDAPPPVSLDEAVAAVTSDAPSTDSTTAPTTTAPAEQGIAGNWAVEAGEGSFAGYRVEEELARVGFTTAAGRTEDVEASLTISGDEVVAVDVLVDMQTLTSDDSRRDSAIRNQALETNAFPTATFTLIEPIALPPEAASGDAFSIVAIGDLELHGVTNRVELALDAQLTEGVIAVVGSTTIAFEDYDIAPPTAPVLLSVDETGLMEFQLLFQRG